MKKSNQAPDWAYDLATATQTLEVKDEHSPDHSGNAQIDLSDPTAVRDEICRTHPFGEILRFEGIVDACANGQGASLLHAMSPDYLAQFDGPSSDLSACSVATERRLGEVVDADRGETNHGYRHWVVPDDIEPIKRVIDGVIAENVEDISWIDDEFEEGGMEKIQIRFAAMEVDDLVIEFIDGQWWDCVELHDELRRACSGSNDYSKYLARRVGFEFLTGNIRSEAYIGNGPLSKPLEFTSVYPETPSWNEEPIVIREASRRGAVTLLDCFSFMMH
ncbi:hypothetical protein AB8B02_18990 [Tardiphaga sp. 862_B3_N4_1]|uniref:hypothetical protein n=1 Tax=Tardiphaga sp. 862_B3_N4_1 TaxID=3240764 RepID=UPI003F27B1B3